MKQSKKEAKLKELNDMKKYVLSKSDNGVISQDFLCQFFCKNKLQYKKIVFGMVGFDGFVPIKGYMKKVKQALALISKNRSREKLENYKIMTQEKLKKSKINNDFWYEFFNKGNINLKNIVLGIKPSEFKDFTPINNYDESIAAYNIYKVERERKQKERLENEWAEMIASHKRKVAIYKENNKDDLIKVRLENMAQIKKTCQEDKDDDFSVFWNLLQQSGVFDNDKETQNRVKNIIIDSFFSEIESEINLYLAIDLFPSLSNMLAYEKKVDVFHEDLGFDVSSYPFKTNEKHKRYDYKTIDDVLQGNYESYTEATYISGSGINTPSIESRIEREVESVHYNLMKNILADLIDPDVFELKNTQNDEYEFFLDYLMDNMFIIGIMDYYNYFNIIKSIEVEKIFTLYNSEESMEHYRVFLLN